MDAIGMGSSRRRAFAESLFRNAFAKPPEPNYCSGEDESEFF
jgi:hypothetical protein